MNRLVAIALVLLGCLLGWIYSASPLPTGCTLFLILLFGLALLTPLSKSPLLTICLATSMAISQWYLFGTGRAIVMLAELPWYFHLGLGLHWVCVLEAFRVRQGLETSPLPLFWIGLFGSLLLLWTGGAVEVYEANIWMAHSIAGAPLVLILWSGIFQGRAVRWKRIAAGAFTILALGQLIGLSNSGANVLYQVFKSDEDESYLEDYGNRGPATGGNGGNDSSARELPIRANITFDQRIRFYLQVDESSDFRRLIRQPIYVRTSTVSIFESDSKISPVRVGEWDYDSDDGTADALTNIKSPLPGNTIQYALLLNREDADQIPMLAETHLVATDAVYEFADDWYQIAPHDGISWIRLRGEATYPASRESIRVGATSGRIDFSSDYMRLPLTDLTARISKLTDRVIAGRNRAEIPEAIAAYLKGNHEYSLQYRNHNDLPPVENFLFDEKKGHCEMYAAAAVMMLRSAGIPSRIAYGYTGGSADFRTRMLAFRDSDFHAWPEIFDTDEEWKIFDTTPVTNGAASRSANPATLEKIDLTRYEDVGRAELLSENRETFLSTWLDAVLYWMSGNFLFVFAGIGALTLVYWSIRRRADRKSSGFYGTGLEGETGQSLSSTSMPAFVTAISDLGESYGYRREPSQTIGEYVDLLLHEGVGSDALRQGVEYFYKIRYVGQPRNSATEKQLFKEIRSLV